MDKIQAYDILSRYKENKALSDEMSEAIGLALEALKPKNNSYFYGVILSIRQPKTYKHILNVEMSEDKALMQEHLKEWRKKLVERIDKGLPYLCLYNGGSYNYTTNNINVNFLPFMYNRVMYEFRVQKISSECKERFEEKLFHDRDAVVDIMNELKF